jgi:DNA polymerase elongation subunit (family B)
MKILALDIESSPNTAHIWGLWNQNISINQLMESSYVLCWAAKWLDTDEIMYDSVYQSTPKRMLKRIHKLLDEADAVIHYNGTKFDIPTLNKEFLLNEMSPPAPYKQIDLLKVARNTFKFPSNKLDYVANALGVGQKIRHPGHELWVRCMNGDDEAWQLMETYNKHDVKILERVYYKLLPWIKTHPNHGLHTGSVVCTNCGGLNHQQRGYYRTKTMTYKRYQCKGCGTWLKSITAEKVIKPTFTQAI